MTRALLTVQAWLALALFDIARLAGFARIHAHVRRRPVTRRFIFAPSHGDLIWAIDEACVWYVKRVACLQRSVVAACMLRRYGHAASLVLAYRPVPFESHAWVEIDGTVVNDWPEYQKWFTVIERA